MIQLPYIEPVFRPPSEARSLILQVTNGCSWGPRCNALVQYRFGRSGCAVYKYAGKI